MNFTPAVVEGGPVSWPEPSVIANAHGPVIHTALTAIQNDHDWRLSVLRGLDERWLLLGRVTLD
ncbi:MULTISPECIES: hypothetical protein [unclassified Pseudomonas]|uniref:hypothetical protein n=1 Tax=unclassified Pseudomonas TaxID=196821 RepID=UPI00384F1B99